MPSYSYFGRLHLQVVQPSFAALDPSTAPVKVWLADCPFG